MKKYVFLLMMLATMILSSQAMASQVVINYVPAYDWYNGCGPTAAGMVIGYWDTHGYDNLFSASGWDLIRGTDTVKQEISSDAHNAKYNSTPDDPNLPTPEDTSIADFFHTSEGYLAYGNSSLSYADDVFIDYATYRGYEFDASSEYFSDFSWSEYITEIDAGRPMIFAVDTDQNGVMNHEITAIGYEDRGADGLWYASYSTWSEDESNITWNPFRGLSSSWDWGIGFVTFVKPVSLASAYTLPGDTSDTDDTDPTEDPVVIPDTTPTATPEPATFILLIAGISGVAALRRMKN